jgi:DNA-binding response OmpR family regulator
MIWSAVLRIALSANGVFMKRRILLVDDDLAILLTLKAVLEIQGFDVTTAGSAREAKMKLRQHEFHMVITDNRMESENAGLEVASAAKKAPYQPAVALLTAFPVSDDDDQDSDADEVLVKPMNTQALLLQLEALLVSHEDKKQKALQTVAAAAAPVKKTPARPARSGARKPVSVR